jgi:hypothetical protein
MYMKDVSASFKDSDGIFTGKIKGVDQIGRLIIEKRGVDCFMVLKRLNLFKNS